MWYIQSLTGLHAGDNIFLCDILLIQNDISYNPQRDVLGYVAGTSTSQHPVFKSHFQLSRADCSAARLPERKKVIRNFALWLFCYFILVSFSLRYAFLYSPWETMPVYYMVKVSLCVYSLRFFWIYTTASYLICSIARSLKNVSCTSSELAKMSLTETSSICINCRNVEFAKIQAAVCVLFSLLESSMGRNPFWIAGLDELKLIFRWIHVLSSICDSSASQPTFIRDFLFACCRELQQWNILQYGLAAQLHILIAV